MNKSRAILQIGCALGMIILPIGSASPRAFCSEPIEPYCSFQAAGSGEEPADRLVCGQEIELYVGRLVAYRRCILALADEVGVLIEKKQGLIGCGPGKPGPGGLCAASPPPAPRVQSSSQ